MPATIMHLGHCGLLIKTASSQIVIDPNFSRKLLFLNRQDEPFIPAPELKKSQAVLITNAHPNRMDISSYKYFPLATRVFVPKGTRPILGRFIDFTYEELVAGDNRNVGDIRIKAIASSHRALRWSGLRYGLALHYLLTFPDESTLLYATDGADSAHFATIAKENKIDLAVMPVAHVGPGLTAGKRYQTVKTALQGFKNLGARVLVPNAFGSFSFSGKSAEKIIHEIREESVREGIQERVRILSPGTDIDLTEALALPPYAAPQAAPTGDQSATASA